MSKDSSWYKACVAAQAARIRELERKVRDLEGEIWKLENGFKK